jgi:GNAT superfamily N-acetyltransferase
MQIRLASSSDKTQCAELDHSYSTGYVWQMETRHRDDLLTTTFRLSRFPREVEVAYPRQGDALLLGWQRCDGFLDAVDDEKGAVRGYVTIVAQWGNGQALLSDLVVDRPWRRRGIGTALLRAAIAWRREQGLVRVVLPVQTKNYPAVRFCLARGLTFCGYNDHFWTHQDIALLFGG